jgi:hypothetical protein
VGLFCPCLLAPLQSLYSRTPVEAQPLTLVKRHSCLLVCDISLGNDSDLNNANKVLRCIYIDQIR